MIYDVIIIGGGPAGLAAGIYAGREKISALIIEKGVCGGWLNFADLIENYPGFSQGISGMDLSDNMKKQARRFGVEMLEAEEAAKFKYDKNMITVLTNKQQYQSRGLIVTAGAAAKKLNIPGETKYTGKGVSYCATCDGPLFKDKDVIVVGGGNAAAEEALFLTKFAAKVTLIHRRSELRAAEILQEKLRRNKKIELLLEHILVSIEGERTVKAVIAENKKTKEQLKLNTDGVFIYIGFLPNSHILQGIVELDEKGYIKTDENMRTSAQGIYAAGDIRSKAVRQIATAVSDGVIAAIAARQYLKEKA